MFKLDVVCSVSVILLQHRSVLFASLSSGRATTKGRMLGPQDGK